jgi:rhamnopyranosyl-N-acetylglucosaminyl-diphospho-decaprenol beta-1,3/1,4-galactofuranosyltransferase
MTRIAAVVVTFNRKALLVECLHALLAQTTPLDRILVVDNASTDGTADLLRASGVLEAPSVRYLRLEQNTGGAGGFHAGMKAAYDEGHDWLWLMDDDAEPAPDALAHMAPYFGREDISALAPMVTDAAWKDEYVEPHRGMRLDGEIAGVVRPLTPAETAGRDALEITHCSFVGPLFPRRTIDQVGLPIAEFFIHYDDYEYVQRARKVGPILLVMAAKIAHKEARNTNAVQTRTFLSRKVERPKYDSLWLAYYGYRNVIWLTKEAGSPLNNLRLISRHARRLAEVIAYDDQKWRRIRFWNAALLDGWAGRFKNEKPKQILRR